MFFEIELCLEAFKPRTSWSCPDQTGCKVWVWVWLENFSFLQMEPLLDASNPQQIDLSRPSRCKLGVCIETFLLLRDRALDGGRQGSNRVVDVGLARGLYSSNQPLNHLGCGRSCS